MRLRHVQLLNPGTCQFPSLTETLNLERFEVYINLYEYPSILGSGTESPYEQPPSAILFASRLIVLCSLFDIALRYICTPFSVVPQIELRPKSDRRDSGWSEVV